MLSKKGRYALKALINLARCAPASKGVRTIADEERIPRKFLEVIMTELRRGGLVESTRGKAGGFRLSRPADLITFAEIMRQTDGPLALVPCVSRNFYERCLDCDEHSCALRKVMGVVRDQVSLVLDRTTLAHAVAGDDPAGLVGLAEVA
jgi:Rrf2 family protein